MQTDRKLVAIMFTDIVGYTAMMGENEAEALGVITHYEETIKSKTENFGGEVINFYGDGSLCIFPSVTVAMECAMGIQKELHQGVQVPLRIGVHIGEVLFQEGRIYGDGVNIASRIESLGQPGTVLFSEDVYSRISNNPNFIAQLLGSFEFKNVANPINVYALGNEGFPIPPKETLRGKLKVANEVSIEKSIAVLPFENHSNKEDQQYFIDGIADEIRSQLLSINNLKVISRSSCMYFKNKPYTLKEVGKELKVTYALEGRVQVVSDNIKVSVELIDIPVDKQIWSLPPLNKKLDDVFILQNSIAQSVAKELQLVLTDEARDQLAKIPTVNTEAYMLYQKGLELMHRGYGTPEELKAVVDCFEKAIKIDPNFSKAYVGLVDAYLDHIFWGRTSTNSVIKQATEAAMKAFELDSSSGESYGALGAIHYFKFEKELAIKYLTKAIEISPSYLSAYDKLASYYLLDGELDKAIELLEKAKQLDPISVKYHADFGHTYYYGGKVQLGITYILGVLEQYPKDPFLLWELGYLYSGAGEYDKAIEAFTERDTSGKNTNWMLAYCYGMSGRTEEAQDILNIHLSKRKLGYVPAYMIATIYMGLGDKEKALEWLEKDMDDGGITIFIMGLKTDPKFVPVKDDPRFQKILKIVK